jgi:hypothetical protein
MSASCCVSLRARFSVALMPAFAGTSRRGRRRRCGGSRTFAHTRTNCNIYPQPFGADFWSRFDEGGEDPGSCSEDTSVHCESQSVTEGSRASSSLSTYL